MKEDFAELKQKIKGSRAHTIKKDRDDQKLQLARTAPELEPVLLVAKSSHLVSEVGFPRSADPRKNASFI
jgi:hypothetical protein